MQHFAIELRMGRLSPLFCAKHRMNTRDGGRMPREMDLPNREAARRPRVESA